MGFFDAFSINPKQENIHSNSNLDSNHFEALFYKNPSAVFTMDLNGRITSINDRLKELLGYDSTEIVVKKLNRHWFLQGISEEFQSHLHKAARGISSSFETFLIHKNGNQIPVYVVLIPSVREHTDLIFAICINITSLKEYQNTVNKLYDNLEQAQRISNIGSWDYDVIKDEAIWSKQTYRIFGIEDTSIIPSWEKILSYVHPKDRKKCQSIFNSAVRFQKGFNLEHRITREDGEVRTVFEQVEIVTDESGQEIRLVGTIHDITEQKELGNQLIESKEQFQTVADHLHVGIWSVDTKTNQVTFCSQGVEDIYGVAPSAFKENPQLWMNFVHPEDLLIVMRNQLNLEHGKEIIHEYRIVDKMGRVKWVHDQTIPFLDSEGEMIRIDGIVRDITQDKEYTETLTFIAHYDFLTKLPNRTYFEKKLTEHISDSPSDGKQFAVFYLNLDRFRYINESLGREIGDQLLVAVANRLRNILEPNSFLARIGGDEFVICVEDIREVEDALPIAERILKEMKNSFCVCDYELYITVSIGISFFPTDGEDPSTLLKNADHALNKVKELGSNDWQIYSSSMNIEAYKLYRLDLDLRQAMNKREFYLEYQPKVNAKTKRIEGAEALIRWKHPDWGIVSPKEFIALAEENGTIFELGDWVLKEACKLQATWKKEGLPLVPVSVNISPKRLLKTDFVKNVRETIEAAEIDPSLIELELTEYVIIKNIDTTRRIISELKDFGVRFALDDFGTGYSSLSNLMELDIDTLKIDKSFIDGIGFNKKNEGIIKSAIFLSKELELDVVAEGVEGKDQLDFLLQQECSQIQGYIFSKPVSEEKFKRMVLKGMIKPLPTKKNKFLEENRREYYRLQFDYPLCAEMTVIKFKKKDIKLGKSKALIEDISLGGLKYVSNINMPVQEDFILQFTTTIFDKKIHFTGKNVWKLEVDELYQYGFKFTISERERDDFAPLFNQLVLLLKDNSLLLGCEFLQESKEKYFEG